MTVDHKEARMCCRRCSVWAFCVAYKDLKEVKKVPGISSRVPTFTERYIYWRGCTICACLTLGSILIVLLSADVAYDFLSYEDKLNMVPKDLQDDFKYFIIALTVGGVLTDIIFVMSILYLWSAATARRQKDTYPKVRTAWVLLVIGPFLPFAIVPFAAFVQTDLMQADICAQTLASMLQLPPMRMAFRNAAIQGGQNELAHVSLFPPPGILAGPATSDAFKAWPGHKWCRQNVIDWEEQIFSTAWITSSMRMSPDSEPPSTLSLTRQKRPGVVPPAVNTLVMACGAVPNHRMDFCWDDNKLQQADADSKSLLDHSSGDGESSGDGGPRPLMRRAENERSRQATRHRLPDAGLLMVEMEPEDSDFDQKLLEAADPANVTLDELVRRARAWRRSLDTAAASLEQLSAHRHDLLDALRANASAHAHDQAEYPGLGVGGACLTAVCVFYKACVYGARIARAYGLAMTTGVGTLCKLLTYKNLFMSQFSIIDGIIVGCINVKRILPTSCLPGYVLSFAVIGSLPLVLFCFAQLTQQMGHPLFAAAITCFIVWRVMDLKRADILQITTSRRRAADQFDRVSKRQLFVQVLGVIFIIAWLVRVVWLVRNGHIVGNGLPVNDMSINVDFRELFSVPGLTIIIMKFLYTKLTTKLCSTDLLMKAIFDGIGTELQVKSEEHDDICKDWAELMDLPIKTGRKSAKDKEEDDNAERKMDPTTKDIYTFAEFKARYKGQLSDEEALAYWRDYLKPAPTKKQEREKRKQEGGLLGMMSLASKKTGDVGGSAIGALSSIKGKVHMPTKIPSLPWGKKKGAGGATSGAEGEGTDGEGAEGRGADASADAPAAEPEPAAPADPAAPSAGST